MTGVCGSPILTTGATISRVSTPPCPARTVSTDPDGASSSPASARADPRRGRLRKLGQSSSSATTAPPPATTAPAVNDAGDGGPDHGAGGDEEKRRRRRLLGRVPRHPDDQIGRSGVPRRDRLHAGRHLAFIGGRSRSDIKNKVAVADVFVSASPAVDTTLEGAKNDDWVSWYAAFASSPEGPRLLPQEQVRQADLQTMPWYKVITLPGFRLGRTDPSEDPGGVLARQGSRGDGEDAGSSGPDQALHGDVGRL